MDNLGKIEKNLLKEIADITEMPDGAYNIRANGKGIARKTTDNIIIKTKEDKPGIDIIVKENTAHEFVHIPVVISEGSLNDLVYNDFYIGKNADITIIAGCGIHNDSTHITRHDGIHAFYLEEGAKIKYVEKHYGEGIGSGERVLNPQTIIELKEGSTMEIETVQIRGVDSTLRDTIATLDSNTNLIISEKLLTDGSQFGKTKFSVNLKGENATTKVTSRSVAKGNSTQEFVSNIEGNNKCFGHVECDAIIMDDAKVTAIPRIDANNVDANLIHEAAIGKIAGEQVIKLMSLGLTEKEAEEQIINGFLK